MSQKRHFLSRVENSSTLHFFFLRFEEKEVIFVCCFFTYLVEWIFVRTPSCLTLFNLGFFGGCSELWTMPWIGKDCKMLSDNALEQIKTLLRLRLTNYAVEKSSIVQRQFVLRRNELPQQPAVGRS